MRIAVVTSSPKNSYMFNFSCHKSFKPEEHEIEDGFYLKWNGSIPQGVHFEFRINSKEILEHPLLSKKPNPLHVHTSEKNGNHYVCWTGHLADFYTAMKMLRAWCAGTVYTMENERNFAAICSTYYVDPNDFEAVKNMFKNEFEITVDYDQSGD